MRVLAAASMTYNRIFNETARDRCYTRAHYQQAACAAAASQAARRRRLIDRTMMFCLVHWGPLLKVRRVHCMAVLQNSDETTSRLSVFAIVLLKKKKSHSKSSKWTSVLCGCMCGDSRLESRESSTHRLIVLLLRASVRACDHRLDRAIAPIPSHTANRTSFQ